MYPKYPLKSWLKNGIVEYTTISYGNGIIYALSLSSGKTLTISGGTSAGTPIRPNFYLDSSVQYSSGKGTKESPIILKIN